MGEISNMPIMWQNALMQFSTEIARKAWVWFAETRGHGMQYAADQYAGEVDMLVVQMRPMLDASQRIINAAPEVQGHASDEVMDGLMRFILVRHANFRLGSNVKPAFLVAASGLSGRGE